MREVSLRFFSGDEAPSNFNEPIIYVTGNNKVGTLKNTADFLGGDETNKFSGFEWLREKYNIKYWCYQSQLAIQSEDK